MPVLQRSGGGHRRDGLGRRQQCDRRHWHTQKTNRTAQRLYDWIAEKPG